jgi:hypothetical protein
VKDADPVATVRFKLRRSVVSLPGGRRPEATDRAGLEGLENFPNALVSSRTRATTAVDRGGLAGAGSAAYWLGVEPALLVFQV